ncbi:hypothetical protein QR680_012904 [Steinernema hermaphroditum]|uniref:Protein kinase domain-containing protein n=1 Tax=Steinernema hermaphroditum TaxID=289476 RepID=A0AA39I3P8_9BILA|nr:hypothetical protein QR680_012904 [Steinernema hermaphroditum]
MSSSAEKDVERVQKFASYPLIPRPHLDLGRQLGRGAFGSVFQGTWRNGDQSIVVAVKKVFMLEKEADILSKVRHRNIIQFFGVCHTNPDFFIVTEFAENGCLFEYLHERADFELDFSRILSWAIQIAHGVQYLHCEAPVTIIHRDLKSKNVVLGKQLVCKLCDFGTSKDLTHSYTQPTWGGTAAWMSPEIINQHEKITTASDVWSFAVVLWELTSREIPYKGLSEFKIYTIISTLSERLVIPDYCPKELANLLRSCWRAEPEERPTMREVVTELERIGQNEELTEEVATFVKEDQRQWKEEIGRQLRQLDDLRLDLARKSEELDRREWAIRKRENSQRNLLLSTAYSSHVAGWSVDAVCDWIRNLAAVLETPVDAHVVTRLLDVVRKYDISGHRLLEITPHDLDALGIESLEVRAELSRRISDLKVQELGTLQYPSLQLAAQIEERQKKEKGLMPFNVPIVLHLGLYQRKVFDRPGVPFRYKVFVDTDWKQSSFMIDDLPPEITDSSTVIQHVTISIVSKEKKLLLDNVRCVCPPFGYLEWLDAREDQEEVTVVCVVTYTDQVLQPRNTCIRTKIRDCSKAATVEERSVSLRLRPIATGTTITRRNSSFLVAPPPPASPMSPLGIGKTSSLNLLAVAWRNRHSTSRFSSASPEVVPEGARLGFKNQPLLGKSPIWAEIAATLRQSPRPASHAKSSPAISAEGASKEPPVSKQLPARSISDYPKGKKPLRMPKSGRLRKVSFGAAPLRKRSTASTSLAKEATPLKETTNGEARPSFYLDNEEEPTTTGESSEGPSQRNDVTPPESPTTAPLKRCCERYDCRRQKKPTMPVKEVENEKAILAEDGRLLRPKKNRRRGPVKAKESTPPEDDLAAQLAKATVGSRSSRNVYGGNNKWSWKPAL